MMQEIRRMKRSFVEIAAYNQMTTRNWILRET